MKSEPKLRWLVGLAVGLFAMLAETSASAQTADQDAEAIGILILVLIFIAIYFIPCIVAFSRQHPNRWVILIINVLFGGTGIGWLGSLVWAFSAVHRSPSGSHGGESGLNVFANDPVQVQIDPARPNGPLFRDAAAELTRLKALYDAETIDEGEYRRLRVGPLNRLAR